MPLSTGMIMIWAGAIVDIPVGWTLCNGANGTPDLRNKFVVGAGDTYNPADTGGAINHNHTFTSNAHSHTMGGGGDIGTGAEFDKLSSAEAVPGTTNNANGLPPYYALAYIMKT